MNWVDAVAVPVEGQVEVNHFPPTVFEVSPSRGSRDPSEICVCDQEFIEKAIHSVTLQLDVVFTGLALGHHVSVASAFLASICPSPQRKFCRRVVQSFPPAFPEVYACRVWFARSPYRPQSRT